MAERETEYKYSLSKSEYDTVRTELGSPLRERTFINRYFQVETLTERRDWVLRLRVADECKELTLKIGREVSPGVFDSMEYSALVENEYPSAWESTEPVQVLRKEISSSHIVVQGESKNKRLVFASPIPVGEFWELDNTLLPGGLRVFELEVEVQVQAEKGFDVEAKKRQLESWLIEAGVGVNPNGRTKYSRFLDAIAQN